MQGWVSKEVVDLMRELSLKSKSYGYPLVEGSAFQVGDEVLLDLEYGTADMQRNTRSRVPEPPFIGVLVARKVTGGTPALRIQLKGTNFQQWRYWRCVIGWRRPGKVLTSEQ